MFQVFLEPLDRNTQLQYRGQQLVARLGLRRTFDPELVRVVDPDVLARAGEEGRVIFGLGALPPYLELWQWDRDTGTPTEQAAELRRN